MGVLDERKLIAREKRNSTITAYYGQVENLRQDLEATDIRQRIRTFSQSTSDELIIALDLLSSIQDIAVVIHGVIGCSTAMIGYQFRNNKHVKNSSEIEKVKSTWYSTNLDERDTIMGGDEKVRATVERAYHEQNPKVIFVVGTSVVAINNDDMTSVVFELQEELQIPIILINTDGFKTKAGINGSDIVLHGIGRYLIPWEVTEKQVGQVNIISTTLNNNTKKEIHRVFDKLGLQANVIPRYATIEEIRTANQSIANMALNSEEAEVLLQGLEEIGVPTIKAPAPIGTKAIRRWLEELGKNLELQEKIESFILEEEKKVESYIANQPLKGEKVYIDLPASLVVSTIELIEDLGGEVAGVTIPFVDENNKENLSYLKKELYVQVGDSQLFELANIFSKNHVKYYIAEKAKGDFVSKQGVIPIPIGNKNIFFYQGIKTFVDSIHRAKRSETFTNYISKDSINPYAKAWTKKSTNWYIKQEVK